MRPHLISLFAATAALCMSENALAGDMPVKAPVYKAPVYKARPVVVEQPTGFYIGGHLGAGWSYNSFVDHTGIFATSLGKARDTSFLGGAQAGYNWQFATMVFGIQGDITFTDFNARTQAPGFPTTTFIGETKWISTLTGRVGYAWDKSLWYAKGGAAWVRDHYTLNGVAVPVFNFKSENTRSGYVVGGGVEYAFAPNFSGFVEYNYIELTGKNISLAEATTGVTTALDVYQNLHLVKVGINYKLSVPHW